MTAKDVKPVSVTVFPGNRGLWRVSVPFLCIAGVWRCCRGCRWCRFMARKRGLDGESSCWTGRTTDLAINRSFRDGFFVSGKGVLSKEPLGEVVFLRPEPLDGDVDVFLLPFDEDGFSVGVHGGYSGCSAPGGEVQHRFPFVCVSADEVFQQRDRLLGGVKSKGVPFWDFNN